MLGEEGVRLLLFLYLQQKGRERCLLTYFVGYSLPPTPAVVFQYQSLAKRESTEGRKVADGEGFNTPSPTHPLEKNQIP